MNYKTESYCSAWWAAFEFVTGRGLRTTDLNECGGSYHFNCISKNEFGTAI